MKHFYFIFLGICILFLTQPVEAQRCGQAIYDSLQLIANPKLKQDREAFEKRIAAMKAKRQAGRLANAAPQGIITIPIVVHVIYNSASQNISDAQIFSQIPVLNQDYRKMNTDVSSLRSQFVPLAADMEVQFVMAGTDPDCSPTNGITRHYSARSSFTIGDDDALIKSYGYWPSDQYLNIWVCKLNDNILGFSQFPETSENGNPLFDGIVITTNCYGRIGTAANGAYNLGRTVTHEVGHWLGNLRHPWGDGNGCGTDYCDDTPIEAGAHYGCTPTTAYCDGNPPSVPMIENFMDYTDDRCMSAFTLDQKARMRDAITLSNRRSRLLSSRGVMQLTDISLKLPLYEGFEVGVLPVKWDTNIVQGNDGFRIVNSGGYGRSTKSISVNNTSGNSVTEVVLPPCNFIGLNKPVISFDHALNLQSGQTGTLSLYYVIGCSTNWSPLVNWSADELSTVNSNGVFVPEVKDWNTHYKDLSALFGSGYVQLKLVWQTSSPVQLYLDNIQLIENSFAFNLYPNPAENYFNVEAGFPGLESWSVEVYDTYGAKVLINETIAESAQIKKIYLPGLQAGVYYVNIISDAGVDRKKLVVKATY